jgi:hypothetical protein
VPAGEATNREQANRVGPKTFPGQYVAQGVDRQAAGRDQSDHELCPVCGERGEECHEKRDGELRDDDPRRHRESHRAVRVALHGVAGNVALGGPVVGGLVLAVGVVAGWLVRYARASDLHVVRMARSSSRPRSYILRTLI